MTPATFFTKSNPTSTQSGATLLEVLVALLIFSFGMLGILGLQASTVGIGADARFRTEAAALADELIATMQAGDIANIQTDFNAAGGAKYTEWQNKRVLASQAGLLPDAEAELLNLIRSDTTAGSGWIVRIRISWKVPSSTFRSSYTTVAAIPGNQ